MADDVIKNKELDFNQFVATEDDLHELKSLRTIDDLEVPNTAHLDVPTVKPAVVVDPVEAPKETNHEKELESDYQYMRNNLYTITEKSIEALNNLSQIADQSQHPRAYEVLSLLIKTIADAQKDLISIHKEKVKIETEKTKNCGQNHPEIVNNNLFVGTTAQLDEIIAQMSQCKKETDE